MLRRTIWSKTMNLAVTPFVERFVGFVGTFSLLGGLLLGAAMFIAQSV